MTCPIPNCNKGFTIKHQLTKHLQTAHANQQDVVSSPRRLAVKRVLGAPGKHNCYFESCDAYFDSPEELNDHLTQTHGLSIVKNAGKRSKMDVMFSEQLKNQEDDQQQQHQQQQMHHHQDQQQQQLLQHQQQQHQQQQQHNHMVANIMSNHHSKMEQLTNAINHVSKDLTTELQHQQQRNAAAALATAAAVVASVETNFKCHQCNVVYDNDRDFKVHNFYKHPETQQKIIMH